VLPADSNFHTQKRSDREAGVTRSPCRCGLGRGWGGVRGEEAALFPEAAVTAMCSGGGGSLASSGDDGRARQRRRGAGVIGVGGVLVSSVEDGLAAARAVVTLGSQGGGGLTR
jgi:hypothetical protein